jgi:hypothetical protein
LVPPKTLVLVLVLVLVLLLGVRLRFDAVLNDNEDDGAAAPAERGRGVACPSGGDACFSLRAALFRTVSRSMASRSYHPMSVSQAICHGQKRVKRKHQDFKKRGERR